MLMTAALTTLLWAHALCQQFPGNRDCALTLPRPGFNGIEGPESCITYEAVNEAFRRARDKVGLRSPNHTPTVFNLALLGTALQETTRLLADRFRLSRDDVVLGLPRINTLRTEIADFCPRSHRTDRRCKVARYRRHDGGCNNLQHPTWGSAHLAFKRLLQPVYADAHGPRPHVHGGDEGAQRPPGAQLLRQRETSAPQLPPGVSAPRGPLLPPLQADVHEHAKVPCRRQGRLSTRLADELRLLKGGRLKTLPAFSDLGLKDLLPLKLQFPDDGCIRSSPDIYCFLAGDNRANENMALAVLHTMLVRIHNKIAAELSDINPHWDDERLYQETRHIVAAMVQHITFTEFLPMLLGKETVEKYDLAPRSSGYWDGYDPNVDVTIPSAFVTAAFRFGHSLLPSVLERWSPSHVRIGSQRLSEVLKRPFDLYKPGWYDQYVVGLVNQVAQAMDDGVTQEVTNHLFQQPSHRYGMDLASLNLQRAREHGVPGYNNYRHFCGLQPMPRWGLMLHALPNTTVLRYQEIYDIRQIRLSRLLCDASDNLETVQVYAMVLPDFRTNPRISCKSRVLPRLDLSHWRDTSSQPPVQQVPVLQETDEDSNSVEPPGPIAVIAEGRSGRVRFPDEPFLFDFFKK
ncbi:hypothetical protein C0J52_04989 [Blattella germanica]|nr:hypothetical protein C0J52_04989 [Blattella germanica]